MPVLLLYRFAGQYFDKESGLYYNYFRYYDPQSGRYITSDPIGLEAGLNTYGYALQSPLNYNDPTGEIIPALIGAARLGAMAYNAYKRYRQARKLIKGAKQLKKLRKQKQIKPKTKGKPKKKCSSSKNKGKKNVPEPDGGFTADLSKSKAKSRSGHRNAGNKQLHDKMKKDPKFRSKMERRHGSDVFDRTSTSGSGRRNPANTEWDHNSIDPNKLDLRTKPNHRIKTSAEGNQGGGWKRFHRD